MNVFTVLPNYYLNQMLPPQLIYQQSTLKVSPLLSILSQALKTSIISYENVLFSSNQNENKAKNKDQIVTIHKQLDQQPQTPIEEVKQRTNENFKFKRENNEIKQKISTENGQKAGKQSSHYITNVSEVQEGYENKQEKKTRQLSRRIKKDKNRRKKGLINLKIDNINLLQCAHTTKLGINAEELKNRKESLLQRMVVFWDQKFKNRKDRREIRMLNF